MKCSICYQNVTKIETVKKRVKIQSGDCTECHNPLNPEDIIVPVARFMPCKHTAMHTVCYYRRADGIELSVFEADNIGDAAISASSPGMASQSPPEPDCSVGEPCFTQAASPLSSSAVSDSSFWQKVQLSLRQWLPRQSSKPLRLRETELSELPRSRSSSDESFSPNYPISASSPASSAVLLPISASSPASSAVLLPVSASSISHPPLHPVFATASASTPPLPLPVLRSHSTLVSARSSFAHEMPPSFFQGGIVKLLLIGVGLDAVNKLLNPNLLQAIGMGFLPLNMEISGQHTKVQLWSIGGMDKFRTLPLAFYKSIYGIIFTYDSPDGLSTLQGYISNIFRDAPNLLPYSEIIFLPLLQRAANQEGIQNIKAANMAARIAGRAVADQNDMSFSTYTDDVFDSQLILQSAIFNVVTLIVGNAPQLKTRLSAENLLGILYILTLEKFTIVETTITESRSGDFTIQFKSRDEAKAVHAALSQLGIQTERRIMSSKLLLTSQELPKLLVETRRIFI
jgi:GTPase SAR1 family protein